MNPPQPPLTDEQARRLLARAAQIDARLDTPTGLEDLRAAALEAGISPLAFDSALRELSPTATKAPISPWRTLRQNLLAAGAFTLILKAIFRPIVWLGMGDLARTLGILVAVGVGIHIADRLGGRWVRTGLIALGAGQTVLFLFKLAGIASSGAHILNWAVLGTGLLAAFAGAHFSRRAAPPVSTDGIATSPSLPDSTEPPPPGGFGFALLSHA